MRQLKKKCQRLPHTTTTATTTGNRRNCQRSHLAQMNRRHWHKQQSSPQAFNFEPLGRKGHVAHPPWLHVSVRLKGGDLGEEGGGGCVGEWRSSSKTIEADAAVNFVARVVSAADLAADPWVKRSLTVKYPCVRSSHVQVCGEACKQISTDPKFLSCGRTECLNWFRPWVRESVCWSVLISFSKVFNLYFVHRDLVSVCEREKGEVNVCKKCMSVCTLVCACMCVCARPLAQMTASGMSLSSSSRVSKLMAALCRKPVCCRWPPILATKTGNNLFSGLDMFATQKIFPSWHLIAPFDQQMANSRHRSPVTLTLTPFSPSDPISAAVSIIYFPSHSFFSLSK